MGSGLYHVLWLSNIVKYKILIETLILCDVAIACWSSLLDIYL